jgi:hypothetical protein
MLETMAPVSHIQRKLHFFMEKLIPERDEDFFLPKPANVFLQTSAKLSSSYVAFKYCVHAFMYVCMYVGI